MLYGTIEILGERVKITSWFLREHEGLLTPDLHLGVFIDPNDFKRWGPKKTTDILKWFSEHERELDAINLFELDSRHGENISSRELLTIVNGEIASDECKKDARILLNRRQSPGRSDEKTSTEKAMRNKREDPPTPRRREGHVYILQGEKGVYKIGKAKNVKSRTDLLHVKLPFKVELLFSIPTNDALALEKSLHERFAEKRVNGEWFKLTEEDLDEIRGLAA